MSSGFFLVRRCFIEVCSSLFIFISPRGVRERAKLFNCSPALGIIIGGNNAKMIGVYRIMDDRVNEMKGAGRFMVVKMFLTLYGLFLVAALLSKDEHKLATVVLLTAMFAVLFLIFMTITFFAKSPIYNTVIEVTDQGLVRSGQELLTVRLKFDEIDKMIAKDNGTILVKKGLNSRLGLYFNKQAYINEFDILFIPLAIDSYENLLRHIEDKIK